MPYASTRSESTVHAYAILKADAATEAPEEFPITADSYAEYEDGFPFYSEAMYYFTGKDGVAYDFDTEDKLNAHLEEHGYTTDY
jgi:hypothetical protein